MFLEVVHSRGGAQYKINENFCVVALAEYYELSTTDINNNKT